eukprot:SAG22_NODE_22122_length_251_cov_0.684211_1_plen_55_part_10
MEPSEATDNSAGATSAAISTYTGQEMAQLSAQPPAQSAGGQASTEVSFDMRLALK